MTKDTLVHVKNKTLINLYELLSSKPEQEQNLLAMLINKLGDQEKKIAAKSVYLLLLLLNSHPNMKLIVIREVQQFLIRPNVALRSQYYAITFLNQIVLRGGSINTAAGTSTSFSDQAAANTLIDIYFAVFERLIGTKAETVEDEKAAARKDKSKTRWRNGGKGNSKNNVEKKKKHGGGEVGKDDVFEGLNAKMLAGLLTGVNRALPYAKIEHDS